MIIICLHAKYPLFLSDFNETSIFSTDIRKILSYEFYEYPSSCCRVVACGPTDRQTWCSKQSLLVFLRVPKMGFHHLSFMELGQLLTRSGLTCPEASSKVCHDSFCQSGSTVLLPRVVCYETFCLHGVSSFSCIPVICPKFELFLTPLQFVYLFCNLPKMGLFKNVY
jgi:hypothetical protein